MKRLAVLLLAIALAGCQPSSLIAYTSEIACSFDTISWQLQEQDNQKMELALKVLNIDCD